MQRNRPPALALQLDRCDVCGDKYHRNDLVRTQVEFLDKKAENFLSYSSYDGTYWVCDAVDEGSVSYGNRCDNVRTALDSDNDIGYINGVQTWSGNGTMRMATISLGSASTSMLVFSVQVGPHEQNTSPSMTVELGITDTEGIVTQAIRTWTISETTRVWFAALSGDLEAYALGSGSEEYYYIKVTNAGKWWIDEMQLEANTVGSIPEVFVRVNGTYASNQSDRTLMTQRKVCSSCSERILSKSERFGKTDESPIADPVETWAQEI